MTSLARLAWIPAILLIGLGWSQVAQEPSAPPKLRGALPVLDASDFPSLAEAFAAVNREGGVLHLPPGEFEITSPLVIERDDVCVRGSGPRTHLKNLNEQGEPAIVIAAPASAKTAAKPRPTLWRIQLEDFRVTGNEKSGHGIEARYINEIYLEGVTVSYHGGDGIRLDLCYEDPRVCNSLITYNKRVGLNLLGCHDIVVSGNQFEENQDALHCLDAYNLCMTGNCVDDHLGRGVLIENTYGSVVSGNMIEECAGTAITLDRDCYGITLSSNVIAHNGAGIDLKDAHGCAVSANTFTLMKEDALRVRASSGRIAISGNNFCNSYVGDGQVRRGTNDLAAAGLVLDSYRDLAITGNVFSGLTTKAVALPNAPDGSSLFRDNVLVDVSSDHPSLPAAEPQNLWNDPKGESR